MRLSWKGNERGQRRTARGWWTVACLLSLIQAHDAQAGFT